MVAPELPTCVAIRQPVFHYHPYCQRNHAMGVMAAGWRHVAQVCHKILVARLTMMLRIGDVQFHWMPRHQISNIVQSAIVNMLSSGGFPAPRAGAVALIAVFFDHLCFRQVFDLLIFDIRLVLARTVFFCWLFGWGWRFHPASLLQIASFGHTFVGSPATVSLKPIFIKYKHLYSRP